MTRPESHKQLDRILEQLLPRLLELKPTEKQLANIMNLVSEIADTAVQISRDMPEPQPEPARTRTQPETSDLRHYPIPIGRS